MIAIAFIIGFIIPAFSVIVLDFLNTNIRTANRGEELMGLKVAAIFPKLAKVSKRVDLEFIKNRGIDVIARRLILNTEHSKEKMKPDTNLFFSILDGEGKTTLLQLLLAKLSEVGYKVLYLTPEKTEDIEGIEISEYSITKAFHRAEKIEDLLPDYSSGKQSNYDYIFLEIPGILYHTYPINFFKTFDHSFLVARANRNWNKSDMHALKNIIEYSENKPQVLLNGVELLEMETVIGELPRKRSIFRRIIKNILQLRFKSNKSF